TPCARRAAWRSRDEAWRPWPGGRSARWASGSQRWRRRQSRGRPARRRGQRGDAWNDSLARLVRDISSRRRQLIHHRLDTGPDQVLQVAPCRWVSAGHAFRISSTRAWSWAGAAASTLSNMMLSLVRPPPHSYSGADETATLTP